MRFDKTYAAVTTMLLLAVTAALAQTPDASEETTATQPSSIVAAAPQKILSVSLPPYARLRLDVDARDEDVLGLVKSFLRGFKGDSIKDALDTMSRVREPAAGDAAPSNNPRNIATTAALRALSDADLEAILSRINHARFVVFETPNPYTGGSSSYQASRARATKAAQSTIAYYENAYLTREGGRRIARGDFDDTQMMVVGFGERGFALVIGAPGMGAVIRADGYPNFEGLGPLLMGLGLLFAPGTR